MIVDFQSIFHCREPLEENNSGNGPQWARAKSTGMYKMLNYSWYTFMLACWLVFEDSDLMMEDEDIVLPKELSLNKSSILNMKLIGAGIPAL